MLSSGGLAGPGGGSHSGTLPMRGGHPAVPVEIIALQRTASAVTFTASEATLLEGAVAATKSCVVPQGAAADVLERDILQWIHAGVGGHCGP